MKLGLGTAQFGGDYGMANKRGRVPQSEVAEILAEACQAGILTLDTAPSYGDSEEAIGRALPAGDRLEIITKTPVFRAPSITSQHAQQLLDSFARSLERLKRDSISGLLIHHADDLLCEGGGRLFDAMLSLKARGLVKKIGVSIYTEGHVEGLLRAFSIDLIQVPVNVFDQRLIEGGQLRRLKAAGVEIHARSAFLQGLLVSDPDALPPQLSRATEALRSFQSAAAKLELTPAAAALRFLTGVEEIDLIVCGVDNKRHLCEHAAVLKKELTPAERLLLASFSQRDPSIIDPSRWNIESGLSRRP